MKLCSFVRGNGRTDGRTDGRTYRRTDVQTDTVVPQVCLPYEIRHVSWNRLRCFQTHPKIFRALWRKWPTRVPPRGWGGRYKLPGSDDPEGGPGPRICFVCFCLSRCYHYLSIVQINPFNASHPATDSQCFRFGVRVLAGPPLLGGGGSKIFFTRARKRFRRPWPALLMAAGTA